MNWIKCYQIHLNQIHLNAMPSPHSRLILIFNLNLNININYEARPFQTETQNPGYETCVNTTTLRVTQRKHS